jgi:hypothetical protein
MTQTTIYVISNSRITYGISTGYIALGSANNIGRTTEAVTKLIYQQSLTFKNLLVTLDTNSLSNTATVTLRKNAAAGNLTVSITSGATGVFEDTAHSDSFVATDTAGIEINCGGGSGQMFPGVFSVTCDHSTDSVVRFWNEDGGTAVTVSDNTNRFYGFEGALTAQTTETLTQFRAKTSGTLKNGYVNVTANDVSLASTARTRKNAATNGNIAVSITGNTLGIFQDTSNTDTITTADDWNLQVAVPSVSGTHSISFNALAVDFTTTNNIFPLVWMFDSGSAQSFNVTTNYAIGGEKTTTSANETFAQTRTRLNFTAKNLNARISANTIATSATSLTYRLNGADTALALSIAAAATGVIVDDSNTVSVVATDSINYRVVTPNTSGALTFISIVSHADTTVTGLAQDIISDTIFNSQNVMAMQQQIVNSIQRSKPIWVNG